MSESEQEAGRGETVALPVLNESEPEGARWGRAHHVLLIFLGLGVVVWLLTGFYQIGPSEVGLVERMGELVGGEGGAALAGTGPHYGLPWPMDIVYKIPVKENRRVKVDAFNNAPESVEELRKAIQMTQGWPPEALAAVFAPYLITADKNVLNAQVTVNYHIAEPEAYFMSVAHEGARNTAEMFAERDEMIAHVASHVLIEEMGRTRVDDALAQGKQELAQRLLAGTRREAARLNLGVEVETVNLEVVHWPLLLNAAFEASIQAQAQARAMQDEAQKYATQVKAASDAEVNRIESEARAYATQMVDRAQGEADRFGQVFTRYEAAPDITRISIYADTVNAILQNVMRTYYVDPGQRMTLILEPPTEVKTAAGAGGAAAAPVAGR